MAKDRNEVCLKGHVGKEPEITTLENGKTVANFTVATNRNYRKTDPHTGKINWIKKTEWHNITVWDNRALDCARMIHKGTRVEIQGYLHSKEWQVPDGKIYHLSEIIALELDIMAPISSLKAEEEPEVDDGLDFDPEAITNSAIALV